MEATFAKFLRKFDKTSPLLGSFRKAEGKLSTEASFDPVAEVGRAVGMS